MFLYKQLNLQDSLFFLFFIIVGSLKAREINSSRIKLLKCHRYGGGSLVVQMNLFDRLARVVKVRFCLTISFFSMVFFCSFFLHKAVIS